MKLYPYTGKKGQQLKKGQGQQHKRVYGNILLLACFSMNVSSERIFKDHSEDSGSRDGGVINRVVVVSHLDKQNSISFKSGVLFGKKDFELQAFSL